MASRQIKRPKNPAALACISKKYGKRTEESRSEAVKQGGGALVFDNLGSAVQKARIGAFWRSLDFWFDHIRGNGNGPHGNTSHAARKDSSKNATGTEGIMVLLEQAIKVFVGNKVGSTPGNILS